MSENQNVSRFCPRCGAKVKGTAEQFATPKTCPSCKSKVLFWDVTKEPLGDLLEATKVIPVIQRKTIVAIAAFSASVGLLVLLLFVLGFVDLSFALSVFFIFSGGYCIAIFLGQQYKMALQSKELNRLIESVERIREQQSGIAMRYSALQDNFQKLVNEASETALNTTKDYQQKAAQLEADFDLAVKRESSKANVAIGEANASTHAMAKRYLNEIQKSLSARINPDNFNQSREKFLKSVEFCRKVGHEPDPLEVDRFLDELKDDYKESVRRQLAREEQARIKEKLREEQKVEAEFQREMKRLEEEEKLLERLLNEARSKATEESAAQIADLERRLSEAKEKERSLSLAQQTKAGNVYIISNIGSFGEGVYKIGMTRRQDPLERVRELGDASVPFPFDVHMMIACQNAPTMENELHRRFTKLRINKVNFRKEFFRVPLDEIRKVVEELHGEVAYQAEPEALQYRESIGMSDEQFETVSELSQALGDDEE
jgi:hypothetical protein